METASNKVELIQNTIQQLIESNQPDSSFTDHHHHVDDGKDTHLLTQLLSQVESLQEDGSVKSLKEDGSVKLSEQPSVELNQVPSDIAYEAEMNSRGETNTSGGDAEDREEDVVKELKKLKKQNRTTNFLLSALIIVTVGWQISEISLLLKLKEHLTHPLRSLGSMVTGVFKRPKPHDDKESPTQQNGIRGLINPSG